MINYDRHMPSCFLRAAGRERGGSVIIVIIIFIMVSAIMAHKLAAGPEAAVRTAREERLKRRLAEYNMTLLRYRLNENKWPASKDELLSRPGYLRALAPDPFTGKTDYIIAEAGGQKYFTSASSEKSAAGKPYNTLTAGAALRFVPLKPDPPPLAELMGFKKD